MTEAVDQSVAVEQEALILQQLHDGFIGILVELTRPVLHFIGETSGAVDGAEWGQAVLASGLKVLRTVAGSGVNATGVIELNVVGADDLVDPITLQVPVVFHLLQQGVFVLQSLKYVTGQGVDHLVAVEATGPGHLLGTVGGADEYLLVGAFTFFVHLSSLI